MKNPNTFKIAGLALFAALNLSSASSIRANASSNLEVQDEVAPAQYLRLTSMCSNDPAATRRWRVRNMTSSPINFTWDVYNAGQNGAGVAQPGDNFFETTTVPNSPNTTRVFWEVEGQNYQTVKASGGAQCENIEPAPTGCFGVDVYSFSQGLTRLGTAVNPERSNPENALGAPNGQNPQIYAPVQNFYSLGLGGHIVIRFETPIANGDGADVKIWESSASVNGERAFIEVSQDGLGYTPVGEIAQTGSISIPDGMDYIQFVKITDSTPPAAAGNSQVADGYDVDAIECLNGAYTGDLINSCYAMEVVSFNQKKRNDGSFVDAGRSNPMKALGMPEGTDTENFFSLGFGGDITLKFGSPIKNGAGADVRVVETTFGGIGCNRYPETINVFASQDGCNFVFLGEGCQDTDFELGSLGWAQYIKIVDVSPVDGAYQGTPIADAYDLDGILCLNGYEENPVLAEVPAGASEVISYTAGPRKNGTPVTPARTNPENALGAPQGTDVINFVSLGFGGQLILKFPFVIFDNPAENDLRVTETTFGSPECATYPETAEVEGSLDGSIWVSLGTICLDGEIDINAAGAIQYIRITDRTPATSFNGSADGYDVDGVVVINNTCGEDASARISDNNTTPDEVAGIEVYPNPFVNETNLVITSGDQDNTATVIVTNYLGQQISNEKLNVAPSTTMNHLVNMAAFKSGIYFISVETNSTKEVIKVVKQ